MTPHTLFIHCTATRPMWWHDMSGEAKVAEVRRWHLARGWRDIGYHWLIDRDGKCYPGRPESAQGAHAKGHNCDTLAVSLFGGHGASADDSFSDHFTPEQERALRKLIDQIKERHPTVINVRGHNEVANKGCPGFSVPLWLRTAPPAPPADEIPPSPWAALFNAIARFFR